MRTDSPTRRSAALTALAIAALLAGSPVATGVAPQVTDAPADEVPATVSAGLEHTCATFSNRVWCWGSNEYGQLGMGTTSATLKYRPGPVNGLTGAAFQVTAGDRHTCAFAGGALKCWGANDGGQLGDGTTEMRSSPVQVDGLSSGVSHAEAGRAHTCAVVNGAVWCWGSNGAGQLGDGTTNTRTTPVSVIGMTSGATRVAAGGSHSCAIVNGGAWCWGSNQYGQLGNGSSAQSSPTPVAVTGLSSGVAAITSGGYHSCAITSDQRVLCWGANWFGQLGDGTQIDRRIPVDVYNSSGTSAVEAGDSHTCAVRHDYAGDLWCWGWDEYGQTGDGTRAGASPFPNPVCYYSECRNPKIERALAVTAGATHSCGVLPSGFTLGSIVCWASNWYYQLGVTGEDRLFATFIADAFSTLVFGLSPYGSPGVDEGGRLPTYLGKRLSRPPYMIDDGWVQVPWLRYRQNGGGTRPAFGDVDGDGLDELVIGLTNTGFTNGWIVVLDDAAHDYAPLQWIQVQWPAYNEANGETFPALGDVDGDGRAEIVVGLGQGSGGWIEIFDDATAGFAHLAWRRVNWWAYQRADADGRTHPVVADFDGDGESEIVLGLGGGSNGWLEVLTGASGSYAHRAWVQVPWLEYTQANGTTYPAAGDWDGDGKAELLVGLGSGGGCWCAMFDDASADFGYLAFRRLQAVSNGGEYCAAVGALRPALGWIAGVGGSMQVVFGTEPYQGILGGGQYIVAYIEASGPWLGTGSDWNGVWADYGRAGGGLFPAIGRQR